MLKKTAFYAVPAALALLVGACTTQQPAPVVAGTSGGGSAASSSNPYGATPYEPNAGNNPAESAPYTPPASQSYPAAASGGYIPSNAPVDINAATHTVVRGDTVYNIAKRYQITQDNLRAWNNMADNTISVGQVLRVKPAGYTAPAGSAATSAARTQPPAASSATPNVPSTPQANTSKVATPATTPTVSTGGVRNTGGITWQRPTAGNPGQPVVAAADGKVVYAGSGLRGYGNLVIIQHSPTFLSAYGHNQSLLVNEGQTVKRGQTIAKMGNSDASRTQLHFEVRQNGKPVNPANYVAF